MPADLGFELIGGACGDDASAVDDGDVVGELIGLCEILRGEQQRGAVTDELADDVPQRQPAARIQTGGRFVESGGRGVGKAGVPHVHDHHY
ncbi:hypothetical protein [Brevibacterium otitidis]|uniref:Uncharacterized protein n=1 Tax=Brevibacterium otitidis TaxID=53364 RepID=A0ABV5X5P2_9MICO